MTISRILVIILLVTGNSTIGWTANGFDEGYCREDSDCIVRLVKKCGCDIQRALNAHDSDKPTSNSKNIKCTGTCEPKSFTMTRAVCFHKPSWSKGTCRGRCISNFLGGVRTKSNGYHPELKEFDCL